MLWSCKSRWHFTILSSLCERSAHPMAKEATTHIMICDPEQRSMNAIDPLSVKNGQHTYRLYICGEREQFCCLKMMANKHNSNCCA